MLPGGLAAVLVARAGGGVVARGGPSRAAAGAVLACRSRSRLVLASASVQARPGARARPGGRGRPGGGHAGGRPVARARPGGPWPRSCPGCSCLACPGGRVHAGEPAGLPLMLPGGRGRPGGRAHGAPGGHAGGRAWRAVAEELPGRSRSCPGPVLVLASAGVPGPGGRAGGGVVARGGPARAAAVAVLACRSRWRSAWRSAWRACWRSAWRRWPRSCPGRSRSCPARCSCWRPWSRSAWRASSSWSGLAARGRGAAPAARAWPALVAVFMLVNLLACRSFCLAA